ncbi:MAG TPA: oxygenase MpaB family protein [Polyangiales bacterium]
MTKRIDVRAEIERLDPKEDCQRIVFLTGYLEFSWDMVKALELALFRTFAVPEVAGLLDRTGEFGGATQRRYDDTAIIINEILINGYDSKRGRAFLERMNHIHGMYRIKNEDFLYTLSTFVFVPIDWIDRFGWRKLYPNERLATFYFWREVGLRMNIKDIPETYEAFEAWTRDYERRKFGFSESAQRVGNATRDLLLSFYLPKLLWKPAYPFVYALMDDPLLRAMGYPKPSRLVRGAVELALQTRAKIQRVLPRNKYPKLATLEQFATHPKGYTVDDIGPPAVRRKLAKDRAAATGAGSGCPAAVAPDVR